MKRENMIWQDRKRNFLGLPWSFTKYALDDNRLFVETGVLSSREDEIRLYRIVDLTLTRSLWQKITKTGTIHLDTVDRTMKNFDIKNIKNPYETKEQLSELVEEARKKNRVYARESMGYDEPYDGFDEPDDMDDNH